MKRTIVRTGTKSYPVIVHEALLEFDSLPEQLLGDDGRCIVITDENIAELHLSHFEKKLRSIGLKPKVLTIAPGETSKNSRQMLNLAQEMVWQEARRNTPVIALGGGVVGDLAGLVASLYLRGVPFVQVPTTLLAQVDSSIGGKTGIDLPEGKNLLGTFWHPEAVWTWVGFLKTLPAKQVREGLSECLKYGYIMDPAILERSTLIDPKNPLAEGNEIMELIHLCVESKARIVGQDVTDKGKRQFLYFGHRFGHAIEAIAGYKGITHGEAVAIGMTYESLIAESLGIATTGMTADIKERLRTLGLPYAMPRGITVEMLVEGCKRDKKRTGEGIRFALVRQPGQCVLEEIDPSKLLKILRSIG